MTAKDPFRSQTRSRAGGPSNLMVVAPNDDADLPFVSQWIYVQTAGALQISTAGGQTLLTPEMASGWHPMEVTRIYATGTTADGIMVGW